MPALYPMTELLLKTETLYKALGTKCETREQCVSLEYLVALKKISQGDRSVSSVLATHS